MIFELTEELTDLEMEVYMFIKKRGELLTKSTPPKMMGAIPNLKNKGLVEVFKRRTSLGSSKKRKYVRAKKDDQNL